MGSTPEILVKRFNLPEEMGKRPVARSWHAFRGTRQSDRRIMLGILYSAIANDALPAEGYTRKSVTPTSQQEMAAAIGCTRTSFTRNLSRLAELSESYNTPESRREHAEIVRRHFAERYQEHATVEECPECAAGRPCVRAQMLKRHAEAKIADRPLPSPLPMFKRQRQWNKPNRMGFLTPGRQEQPAVVNTQTGEVVSRHYSQSAAVQACERVQKKTGRMHQVEIIPIDTKKFRAPQLNVLADETKNPQAALWDAEFEDEGYKEFDRWIFDPSILDPDTGKSLSKSARLAMVAYQHKGLMDEFHDAQGNVTKPAGYLQLSQREIAEYVGLSVRALYDANQKWIKLGVLRIVADPKQQADGSYVSGPQQVIYLPMKQLTEEEAAAETDRVNARLAAIVAREGEQRLAQLKTMERLTTELLRAWKGSERKVGSFRRELAKQAEAAGVDKDLVLCCAFDSHPRE